MSNPNEIAALKASFRGAVSTATALASLTEQIEALPAGGDIDSGTLEDLQRVTAAHAIASAALRGLVNTIVARRSAA